ncbi:succinate dehydrogenase / fumarate reductase cytochrome b subunit [Nocardioides albertanoniae]|uniref:Succinate dehydrogenase / fumarate reductase cytochrome b subunit n=1 Tax=Nocardioides albertanoniae TaxID=1175486 RepID=A0A543ACC9_9ACTN|nr:succinate dehydrogenase / fumarate reductase cytochrome b subunit [Nocardioides albertanoniae]
MRAVATTTLIKGARSTRSTIALKLLMAASGIVFILFVLAHMYGNLKAFSGEMAYNEYAHHLRTFGEPMLPYGGLLWILRVVLLGSLVAHVGAALALTVRARKQRPVKYSVKKNKGSSLSSRTMRWGGVALLLFVIWHLLQFTIVKINVGSGGQAAEVTENPFRLLTAAFQPEQWWMVIIYLLAMLALAFHLHHGTFSSLQTLGFTNTAESRARARVAGWVVAIVVAGGFSLVPLFTVFGVIS